MAGRPRKYAEGSKEKPFSSIAANLDVAKKYIVPSENYEDIQKIKGTDPDVIYNNQNAKLYRQGQSKISIEKWCSIIYGWLMLNPKMLSVSDFYNYPKDNAPFMFTLDEVIEYDSDEIYNLLQERITTAALRKQIDREFALALLREKYGWQRDNEQNINLNTNAKVSFKFGDSNLNAPTTDNNENKE